MNIQRLITDAGNTWYHQNDGFYYYVYKNKPNRLYVKCIYARRKHFDLDQGPDPLPKCLVNASMASDLTGVIRITNGQVHNHDPEPEWLRTIEYRIRCKQKASTSTKDIRTIIEQQSERYPPEAVAMSSSIGLGRSMQQIRRDNEVEIPRTLMEFGRMVIRHPRNLHVTHQGERFFISSTERCALFISPITKRLLRTATTFLMDGTFKCVPRKPKIYQLYIIGAIYHRVMIPIVYCLMQHKEKIDYLWLFEQILNEEPGWNPRHVITDYEEAVQSAIEEKFRECVVQGCWFHFSQAIRKKCGTLGLKKVTAINPDFHKMVKKLMALPLLPLNRIQFGFQLICQEARQKGYLNDVRVLKLFLYMRRQWLNARLIRRISVYNQDSRTNNHMESFNSNLMRHMGGNRQGCHPNIWNFAKGLKRLNHFCSGRMFSIRKKKTERWAIKKKWRRQNRNIARASILLRRNDITVEQFLNRTSYAALNIVGRAEIILQLQNAENQNEIDIERLNLENFIEEVEVVFM